MNPLKVQRSRVQLLTDLPNIGPSMAASLQRIGISSPGQLVGKDPYELYTSLCRKTQTRQDPCVLDVLISVTSFMNGGEPMPWWHFTEARKRQYGAI